MLLKIVFATYTSLDQYVIINLNYSCMKYQDTSRGGHHWALELALLIIFSIAFIGLLLCYAYKIRNVPNRHRAKKDLYIVAGIFIFMRLCMVGFLAPSLKDVLVQIIYSIIILLSS